MSHIDRALWSFKRQYSSQRMVRLIPIVPLMDTLETILQKNLRTISVSVRYRALYLFQTQRENRTWATT